MSRSVLLVVLAAGYSRRIGKPKLLLKVGEETMLRYVTQKALLAKAAGVVVVINTEYPELSHTIHDLPVIILQNNKSYLGMSSSLCIAAQYLIKVSADAGVILLGDQPGIDPYVIDQLMLRYEETGAPVVQAAYKGKPGHPVLFSQALFTELMQISGDQGGRDIVRKYAEAREMVQIPFPEPEDIDFYEDYQRLMKKGGFPN